MKYITYVAFAALVIYFLSCKNKKEETTYMCPYTFEGCRNSDFQESRIPIYNGNDNGIIPDAQTAANTALIYAKNIYPEINEELPLKISLLNDSIWVITGGGKIHGPEYKGGHMSMMIHRKNGRVIHLSHSK